MAQMSRLGSEPLKESEITMHFFMPFASRADLFSYSIRKPRAGCKSFPPQR